MQPSVHRFSEQTRQRYLFGIVGLSFFGVIFLVLGLLMVLATSGSPRYSRAAGNSALTGLALAFVGGALLWGSRIPWKRYAMAPFQRIEVDAQGLTWHDGGAPKTVQWHEVSFVDITETTLTIKTKAQGRLEIPADYDEFEQLIDKVRGRTPG